MCSKLFLVFAMILVCSFSVRAEGLVESESVASIEGHSVNVSLVVQSDSAKQNVQTRLDLVDTTNVTRSTFSRAIDLAPGKQVYRFLLNLNKSSEAIEGDIAWYRLRYRVGESSGVISMSQLIKDLFELRVIGTDSLLTGMKYRVRVRAVNPFSGMPAAGVSLAANVDLELAGDDDRYLKLDSTATTDQDGFALMDFAIPVDANLGGDGEVKIVGKKNGFMREAHQDLSTLDRDKQFLMMTINRSISRNRHCQCAAFC